jgi:hypothetical protein
VQGEQSPRPGLDPTQVSPILASKVTGLQERATAPIHTFIHTMHPFAWIESLDFHVVKLVYDVGKTRQVVILRWNSLQ